LEGGENVHLHKIWGGSGVVLHPLTFIPFLADAARMKDGILNVLSSKLRKCVVHVCGFRIICDSPRNAYLRRYWGFLSVSS